MLAVEPANRESRSSWKDFLPGLRERGPSGVEFVVVDDHAGPKAASREVPPDAVVQRCGARPPAGKAGPGDRRELAEAEADLAARLKEWGVRYDRLTSRVEEDIEETFTCYRPPRRHHKHVKSTNMLERLNEEIERRTHVVRIVPNAGSCRRLVRALAVEAHGNWLEANRYLNVDDLGEHKKLQLRRAA